MSTGVSTCVQRVYSGGTGVYSGGMGGVQWGTGRVWGTGREVGPTVEIGSLLVSRGPFHMPDEEEYISLTRAGIIYFSRKIGCEGGR